MVTYIPLNISNDRFEFSKKFEKELNGLSIFRYTPFVNAHVLYDFKSPTSQVGNYDYILFIDIPYKKTPDNRTNYCKWHNAYVNTIAIAVRRFFEPEVIDADKDSLYTEEGSWSYKEQIGFDKIALRNYVYENLQNIKHFDLVVAYIVSAPKANKAFYNQTLAFNQELPLQEVISFATDSIKGKFDNVNSLLFNNGKKSALWQDFIHVFIETSEKHTKQGILTRKKIDAITRKNTSRLMEQVYNAIGKKLCVIKGRAGTGKTLALLRIMYNQVKKDENGASHHCRLLTYNNMLVMDLNQAMKSIGDFSPTNASISTLHKFFYDIYKMSPVRALHMDQRKIDEIFNLCIARVSKYNALLREAYTEINENDYMQLSAKVAEKKAIKYEELNEINQYRLFLANIKTFEVDDLSVYAKSYVDEKRDVFMREYHRREFLNGYNIIIEQLYLIYHNLDEFLKKYKMVTAYTTEQLRNSGEFKEKYEKLYDDFMKYAEQKFKDENTTADDLMCDFKSELERFDAEVNEQIKNKSQEEIKNEFNSSLKSIKRKVNWSKYILVDEAQDCQLYEKALLLELNGSEDTIVATGGRDQLIRTPQENDWSVCFGQPLFAEKIVLRNVSHRQKGTIIHFLNAFAKAFHIDTQLTIPDDMENLGRVIIDCRSFSSSSLMPLDKINELYINGKDYGCSNFENLLLLLPKAGYLKREKTNTKDVDIDIFGTVNINDSAPIRKMDFSLPEELRAIDGTINDKREILNQVGQDNTRCLLYESCRGLEAWNVLCIDLDVFFYEKISSKDAQDYADANVGLFETDKELFQARYASLWCYMAMTRAMDTLYIRLSNNYNAFSSSLLDVVKQIPNVEILQGQYEDSIQATESYNSIEDIPF